MFYYVTNKWYYNAGTSDSDNSLFLVPAQVTVRTGTNFELVPTVPAQASYSTDKCSILSRVRNFLYRN